MFLRTVNQKTQTVGKQHHGTRDSQQDSFAIIEQKSIFQRNKLLLILADGMGGQAGGAKASKLAVESLSDFYKRERCETAEDFARALRKITGVLARAKEEDPPCKKMGTTLIGAMISKSTVRWMSVGDSPMWILRKGKLIRLNEDHSMASFFSDFIAMGRMTEEEAAAAPNRCVLRSSVDGEKPSLVDIPAKATALNKGDLLILASDGLETLSEDEICQIIAKFNPEHLDKIADELINAVLAKAKPSQDNTTIILHRIC